ncbi:unannotated protein [freshwater metagenome]|uniref:Unannotated protein n=1 Tax=freshwater metagenome TaxID=449393 RepID=A0A6J6ADN0_9ZZZZ|nr:hypothetical protein [Actinomycetota bacterium]MSX60457.1 hypothetical protein [Actinomycetota bacterium]MTA94522.1 hypothetical protein [Actinomycetota bacterium]MTB30542.1 hypothetical protein [Actinomycetota bacterium]
MTTELSLSDIRQRWNEVLDIVESQDRVIWIAYFDARLESFENGRLTLDFRDSNKLATGHNFQETRLRHRALLQGAIYDVFKMSIVVVEK